MSLQGSDESVNSHCATMKIFNATIALCVHTVALRICVGGYYMCYGLSTDLVPTPILATFQCHLMVGA